MTKYVRKNRGKKSLVMEGVIEVEAPTIRKVIEEGATKLFYYSEINNLSIFSLKQSELPAVEL